jgi:flagella basal body P-ring formation protein FlgA
MTERMIKILPSAAKILFAILVMVISMAMFIASINKAMAATLKNEVIITGDSITLGDIFDGVEAKDAAFVLAPAPTPNTTLVWDANTLNRVTKAFDLPLSLDSKNQVTIRRIATVIDQDMISKAIIASLRADGLTDDIELDFVGAKAEIILPHDIIEDITVETSSYNPTRKTFSASIRTGDNQLKTFTGVTYTLVNIPVLSNSARRGDIITRNMIKEIGVRANYITDEIVISADDLVGMTPKKVIAAGSAITTADLDKPMMIKRGDLVTMQFKKGGISLTAIAKAMENGSKGDVIRLMNMGSKRTLEAQVTGLREATIYN